MTDINKELFKRYSPAKKKDIVAGLTERELFGLSRFTVERIIKEVGFLYDYVSYIDEQGRKRYKPATRGFKKQMNLENPKGNNWNSKVKSILIDKNHCIQLVVYIQGDDIDNATWFHFINFCNPTNNDIKVASLSESFSNGYSHTIPANYSYSDRAEVLREILNTYINLKYGTK